MSKPTLALYGIKDRFSGKYPTFVHDHNVCLMQDGKVLQYLQLERLSRRKYDNRLDQFLEDLVAEHRLVLPDEFDVVCVNDFVGSAFVSRDGRFRFEFDKLNTLSFNLHKGYGYYQLDENNGRVVDSCLCQHEIAHICSCLPFYGDFKENSLLVSFDGGSSLGNYAAFCYKEGKLTFIENNWADLGFASKLFNDNRLSFEMLGAAPHEHCAVPGKLMGFASWGKYNPEIEAWLLENDYFNRLGHHSKEQLAQSIKNRFGKDCAVFDTHNPFLQDCAATMQTLFERAVLSKLTSLQERFHCDYLYYGGGCALNIVTNTKILESGLFKDDHTRSYRYPPQRAAIHRKAH